MDFKVVFEAAPGNRLCTCQMPVNVGIYSLLNVSFFFSLASPRNYRFSLEEDAKSFFTIL